MAICSIVRKLAYMVNWILSFVLPKYVKTFFAWNCCIVWKCRKFSTARASILPCIGTVGGYHLSDWGWGGGDYVTCSARQWQDLLVLSMPATNQQYATCSRILVISASDRQSLWLINNGAEAYKLFLMTVYNTFSPHNPSLRLEYKSRIIYVLLQSSSVFQRRKLRVSWYMWVSHI